MIGREHHIVRGARDMAAALTAASRSAAFLPAEAAVLVDAASGLWRARDVLLSALDDFAERLRRINGTPSTAAPVAAKAPAPGATRPQTAAPGAALTMKEASEATGLSRPSLTRKVKRLGLGSWIETGEGCGEWRISRADLPKLAPKGRRAG